MDCRSVDVNHKSKYLNNNIFSFDVALITNLFRNGLRAGWASVLGLQTGSITVNGLYVPGLEQSQLKKIYARAISTNCESAQSLKSNQFQENFKRIKSKTTYLNIFVSFFAKLKYCRYAKAKFFVT